jgi:hypothetical protein
MGPDPRLAFAYPSGTWVRPPPLSPLRGIYISQTSFPNGRVSEDVCAFAPLGRTLTRGLRGSPHRPKRMQHQPRKMRSEVSARFFLARPHQARIAGHIGGEIAVRRRTEGISGPTVGSLGQVYSHNQRLP